MDMVIFLIDSEIGIAYSSVLPTSWSTDIFPLPLYTFYLSALAQQGELEAGMGR